MGFMRARMVLIGGFLGAGKTTLINKIAQKFIEEKVPVGIITNDQGQLLIDTEFIKVRGLNVEEVCGGCFCCNFPKLLDNANKLLKQINPQYIIAEPVGSCTDLIATVATPIKRYHGDQFSVAPLIVLVDAPRLLNNAFDTSTLGGYLRSHQAEEAEYLILTKIDEIGSDDVESLILKLKNLNPDRKIIPYSAVTGEGLQEILEIITSEEETARKPVDVDYDKYAEAEAELGWYNGIYEFTAPEYDSYELSMNILKSLASKYTPSDIAHAKVAITNENSHTKISLIGNEFTIGGVKGSRFGKGGSKLNFNARIVSEPEKLRQTIRETIESCFKEKCIQYKLQFDDCFSPGRPNPTYRILDE